jgi:hypothetical protein
MKQAKFGVESQLARLLEHCSIPKGRTDLSKPSNILWLRRNLSPRNCPVQYLRLVRELIIQAGQGL